MKNTKGEKRVLNFRKKVILALSNFLNFLNANTIANLLEKILLIDLICYTMGKPLTEHPQFLLTWENLSQVDKNDYSKLSQEIHDIWTNINLPKPIALHIKHANSVIEFN